MADVLKRIAYSATKPFIHAVYRQTRGMTLGTRTMVLKDEDRHVLLVRHSYAPGWILPGGGVERGEGLCEAAVRELREEAAIVATGDLSLHGVFLNDRQFPGDHVACFVLRQFRAEAFKPNAEIAEARFHAIAALPDATSPGTRRRIAEVLGGLQPPRDW